MVSPSTREALNKRAKGASEVMDRWAKVLHEALKQQAPARDNTRLAQFLPEPVPESIVLRGVDVQNMMSDLRAWASELEQFTWRGPA